MIIKKTLLAGLFIVCLGLVSFKVVGARSCDNFDVNQADPKCRALNLAIINKSVVGQDDVVVGEKVELLVKFKAQRVNLKNTLGRQRLANLSARRAFNIKKQYPNTNLSLVESTGVQTKEQLKASLEQEADVEVVEYNYDRKLSSIATNDLYRSYLWGLDNSGQSVNSTVGDLDSDIDAPEAWALNEGANAEIVVAVIDSGVNYNHPDLFNQMWDGADCVDESGVYLGACNHGYDFVADDKTPLPGIQGGINSIEALNHGTHVAGTISAQKNNSYGIIGVAPRVKIMALKFNLDLASEIDAIDFAIQNGAKVINASYGGNDYSVLERQAIERFRAVGGIFVAAAGNGDVNGLGLNNDSVPYYPASHDLDNIISVAATDQFDNRGVFSNYGASSVDVGAPGTNIYSATLALGSTVNQNFNALTAPQIPAGWTATGNWATIVESGMGNVLYGDNSRYPYNSISADTVTSETINLSAGYGYEMSFLTRCDTEYNATDDYMRLSFSANGTDFTNIDAWNEYTIDQSFGDVDSTGYSALVMYQFAIPGEYYSSNFKMRWTWVTDANNNNFGGCYIDEIVINSYSSAENYEFMSGTSMATPHVAGLAALIWGAKPDLSYTQVRSLVMDKGETLASMSGVTVSGRRINAYNSLAVFKPVLGYSSNDVIPANQIAQTTDGSGVVTINFKAKSEWSALAIQLKDLEYSINGGSAWETLASTSLALSSNWNNDNYLTTTDWSGTVYDFSVNTKHADTASLNNYSGGLLWRFKPLSTVTSGDFVLSESFTIDNQAPNAPVVTQPATATVTNLDTYQVQGTAEAGSLVKVYNEVDAVVATQQLTGEAVNFSISVNVSGVGDHDFKISASDTLGNQSTLATVPTITKSFLGEPSAVTIGGASTPYYTNVNSPLVIFTVDQAVVCRYDSTDLAYTAMNPAQACVVNGSFQVSCQLPSQGSDGVKNIHVSCSDGDSLHQSADDNYDFTFTLDTQAPQMVSVDVSPNPALAVLVSAEVVLSDLGVGLDYNHVPVVSVSGLNGSYQFSTDSFETGVWQGSFNLMDDNEETTATVTVGGVRDLAGNILTSSNTADFEVDTLAPQAILNNLPDETTASTTATITVTGDSVVSYKYRTALGAYSESYLASTTISLSDLGLGFHTIDVIAGDSSGNWQSNPTTYTWLVFGSGLEKLENDLTIDSASLTMLQSHGVLATTTLVLSSSSINTKLDYSKMSQVVAEYREVATTNELVASTATSLGQILFKLPADTTVRGASAWNSLFNLPRVMANNTVSVTADSGYTATITGVIELGAGNQTLTLNRALRLVLPGQASSLAGYYQGGTFYKINNTCQADSQTVGDALAVGADCRINAGSDLVIYTKHLTSFIVYAQTAVPSSGGGGGGGGGGGSSVYIPPVNYCSQVSYGDWSYQCQAGTQSREVITRSPKDCQLTVTQEANKKRECQEITPCQNVVFGTWSRMCLKGWNYRSVISVVPEACVITNEQKTLLRRACGQNEAPAQVETKIIIDPYLIKPERDLNLTDVQIKTLMTQERSKVKKSDQKFTDKYLGQIINQTEADGVLWYLNPLDKKRYYVGQSSSIDWAVQKFGLKYNSILLTRILVGGFNYLLQKDSDGDGLSDGLERKIGTSPILKDTDKDGYEDGEELKNGYNPLGAGKAEELYYQYYLQALGEIWGLDSDGDGLSDELELAIGTDKNKMDSDGDGYYDGVEVAANYNPLGKNRTVINQKIIQDKLGRFLIGMNNSAWYVDPATAKRYFLGANKLETLRKLAVPMKNVDLERIRVAE